MKRTRGSFRTLASAFAISMAILSGCGPQRFADVSTMEGDPLIVASQVSVDVARYSDAVGKDGSRVERRNIQGFVLMPRGTYARIMAEREAAISSVQRAHEAVVASGRDNAISDELARRCHENPICYAEAMPHITAIIGGE